MSGTIKGVVDCNINTGNAANNNRNLFVNLYNYFQLQVAEGQALLEASFYGNGGAAGFDFHDGPNPAGENAWACFRLLSGTSTNRTQDYWVLIQWTDAESMGTGGGAPGALSLGNDGVGMMIAYTESGVSPWNGTSLGNGADTKGTPVWTDNGSVVHCLTEANETGPHSTNKEDIQLLLDCSTTPQRVHIIGDADCHIVYVDSSDEGDIDVMWWFGAYEPLPGLTIAAPFFLADLRGTQSVNTAAIFNNSSNYSGQMTGFDVTDGIHDFSLSGGFNGFHELPMQPASHGSFVKYTDTPIYITQRTGTSNGGLIGSIPPQLCTHIYNIPNNSTNPALDRAFVPTLQTQASLKYSIAWGGGSPPGSNGGHQGVSF